MINERDKINFVIESDVNCKFVPFTFNVSPIYVIFL